VDDFPALDMDLDIPDIDRTKHADFAVADGMQARLGEGVEEAAGAAVPAEVLWNEGGVLGEADCPALLFWGRERYSGDCV
jgi:hypothetical protein